MDKREYDATRWGAGMECIYNGVKHPITAVDFRIESVELKSKNGRYFMAHYSEIKIIDEQKGLYDCRVFL